MKFTKMHGTGNDFIFLLDLDNKYIGQEESLAKKLCHRRFGIGADGLVLVRKSDIADIKMVIINSDGSWANMCGNAIRCFGKYVYERNRLDEEAYIYSRIKELKRTDNPVTEIDFSESGLDDTQISCMKKLLERLSNFILIKIML